MGEKQDFVSIATPLVERGFRVTPVSPLTKCAVMRNWNKFQLRTVEQVQYFAKYYPDYNVGVVSRRGVGHDMFLDIDAAGIVERIEKETGHKMPRTYRVKSRPLSNTAKEHWYFIQTDYSYKMFAQFAADGNPRKSVNLNRKDMTRLERSKSGLLNFPTMYDVKGIGGASLVVGAGSYRENAAAENGIQFYTLVDDLSSEGVLRGGPIENWLVNWLCDDIRQYRIQKRAYLDEKRRKKEEAKRLSRCEKNKLRESGDCAGYEIDEEDTYDFLRSRAGSLRALGVEDTESFEWFLTQQVKKFCQNGEAFVQSQEGKNLITKIATQAIEDWEPGNVDQFYFFESRKLVSTGLKLTPPPAKVTKQSVMQGAIRSFADGIDDAEAMAGIAAVVTAAGFELKASDGGNLSRMRKEAGFKVVRGKWRRLACLVAPGAAPEGAAAGGGCQ